VVNAKPRPLYPRERSGTHCIGGWVGLRAGLDRCGKSRPPTRIRFPDSPARSESLYRLRSHGSRKAPVLLSLLLPWLLKLLLPNLPWLPWSSVSCDYLCCHDYIGCHNYLYHQVSHCSYGYCGYLVYQCSLLSMVMRTRQKLFAISCPF